MSLTIHDLRFADCYFVSIDMRSNLEGFKLSFEAYIHNSPDKAIVSLNINGIRQLSIKAGAGFWRDLHISYDYRGSDQRSNEVYSLHSDISQGATYIEFESDMLNIEARCDTCEIEATYLND